MLDIRSFNILVVHTSMSRLVIKLYKCYSCKLDIPDEFVIENECPACGGICALACEKDVPGCNHGVVAGLKICDVCGAFVCPICGSHDVSPISRVTGYYSPVDAWCSAKQQELKDRTRYEV